MCLENSSSISSGEIAAASKILLWWAAPEISAIARNGSRASGDAGSILAPRPLANRKLPLPPRFFATRSGYASARISTRFWLLAGVDRLAGSQRSFGPALRRPFLRFLCTLRAVAAQRIEVGVQDQRRCRRGHARSGPGRSPAACKAEPRAAASTIMRASARRQRQCGAALFPSSVIRPGVIERAEFTQ